MSSQSKNLSLVAIIVCGIIFAVSLGVFIYSKDQENLGTDSSVVTPTPADLENVDRSEPGILANLSGDDISKIDVRHGFAVVDNSFYFVRNKTETELKVDQAKTETNDAVNQAEIKPSQLMSWNKDAGFTVVSELNTIDKYPINRLSSLVEKNSLYLTPCIPPTNPIHICETAKVYQFDLTSKKLALLTDVSTSANKEQEIKNINQKYKFDDLGQPYWQDFRDGTVFGIKNLYQTTNSTPTLTGYLMSTKDGLEEKPIAVGGQLAKADLNVNTKGNLVIDQTGTLKESGTCLVEHRILEMNPDKPKEQTKYTIRKLNIDEKGAWNDKTTRTEAEQKTWVANCAKLPEYAGKTPAQLLQLNADSDTALANLR